MQRLRHDRTRAALNIITAALSAAFGALLCWLTVGAYLGAFSLATAALVSAGAIALVAVSAWVGGSGSCYSYK